MRFFQERGIIKKGRNKSMEIEKYEHLIKEEKKEEIQIVNSENRKYGGNGIVNPKVICAKKGETNYKPYYIEVDVAGYAGIVLVHKNGGKR